MIIVIALIIATEVYIIAASIRLLSNRPQGLDWPVVAVVSLLVLGGDMVWPGAADVPPVWGQFQKVNSGSRIPEFSIHNENHQQTRETNNILIKTPHLGGQGNTPCQTGNADVFDGENTCPPVFYGAWVRR